MAGRNAPLAGTTWSPEIVQLEGKLRNAEMREESAIGDARGRIAAEVRTLTHQIEAAKCEIMAQGITA